MNLKDIQAFDKSDLFGILKKFPEQVSEAVKIAENFKWNSPDINNISNIIVNGLGGSAIGGDLNRSFLGYEIKIPFMVNRNYRLSAFANENTLAVISSYSGNTEETTTAYREAIKRNCRILCITSGGEVEKIAKENDHPCLIIPGGLQPRCAIGYSFFTLLITLCRAGFAGNKKKEISETLTMLEGMSAVHSDFESPDNTALKIALKLKGRLPVIYSSCDLLDIVNLRWRGQISENAKMLAYGNLYPEMNHNEIVGWKMNEDILRKTAVIFMKDKEDYERIKMRMMLTEEVFAKHTDTIINIESNAETRLARIFDLIYLGDWVSYYLSILNKVDPTPVNVIQELKNKLIQ